MNSSPRSKKQTGAWKGSARARRGLDFLAGLVSNGEQKRNNVLLFCFPGLLYASN
jgi:hypothetical protein